MAGFVADKASWKKFSADWAGILSAEPSVKYFKMSEAMALRGQFRGWSRDQRDGKLFELASAIKRHVWMGAGSLVSNAAYRSIAKGFLPDTVDHPYWLCFQGLRSVLSITDDVGEVGEKVDLILDMQGIGYERRVRIMHEASVNDELAFRSVRFADEKNEVPLQAADMYAWHLRRHADDAVSDQENVRLTDKVLWSIPNQIFAWTPEAIDDFVLVYQHAHPLSPIDRRTTPEQVGCESSG